MGKVFSTVNWSLCAPKSFESSCFSKITVIAVGGIGNLVGHRGLVALGGLVDAQIVDLHPEVELLVALEVDGVAGLGLITRADIGIADDEVAAADLARGRPRSSGRPESARRWPASRRG